MKVGCRLFYDESLRVEPVWIVAFVGPSGDGKSILAGLVSRFFDPHGGAPNGKRELGD